MFRCVWIFCDVMIMMLDLTWRLFSQYRWHQIHYFAMSFFRPFPRFSDICLPSLISVSGVVDVHSFELMHTPLLFFSFKSHVHTKSYVLKSRPYTPILSPLGLSFHFAFLVDLVPIVSKFPTKINQFFLHIVWYYDCSN